MADGGIICEGKRGKTEKGKYFKNFILFSSINKNLYKKMKHAKFNN
jgi:hypothetical protein